MTQLAPSVLLYSQAAAQLEEFRRKYADGEYKTTEEIIEAIYETLTKFNNTIGHPLSVFDPYVVGEPVHAAKFNRFILDLQNDVNILQDQLDLLRASSVFAHNMISTEIQKAHKQNAQALNKLKTLQLYSNAHDANVLIFGDYFLNEEFIDFSLIPAEKKPSLIYPGNLTLGREAEVVNVLAKAAIKILPESNGFLGNNQEIEDPSKASVNPATKEAIYAFVAEVDRRADLNHIKDGEPNSWIEYENHYVFPADKVKAKNFNFSYRNSTSVSTSEDKNAELLFWANGPKNGVLKLDLEFDLKEVKTVNNITYTPFGLKDNVNHPVKVASVQISETGTDWELIYPQNLWIGTDANLQSARANEKVMVGTAVWTFDQKQVRYIRINIEQPNAIDSNVGHIYYMTKDKVKTTTEIDAPDGKGRKMPVNILTLGEEGQRIEGPIPPVVRPDLYYEASNITRGDIVQKREYFNGKRWAIGVRDCTVEEVRYKPSSTLVSKPFKVAGIIDRVALEADIFVPGNFPVDQLWVKFYVTPNEGLTWFPISRIQDDFNGIPEVIAFNDPLPSEFRESGITYYNVNNAVNTLRLKVEISRPPTIKSSSPIIRSYKLKVTKR